MTTLSDGKVADCETMSGYDTAEGFRDEPLDNRDDEADFELNPDLTSPDFQFSEEDPAINCPEPRKELAPPWNSA